MNILKQIIKEKDKIILKNKADYNYFKNEYNKLETQFIEVCDNENKLFEENKILKNQINLLNIKLDENKVVDKNNFINDDIMYIDPDIFEYEIVYILKNQIYFYEKQINYINEFLYDNNVSNFKDLSKIFSLYNNNNTNINKKYDNIFTNIKNSELKIKSQKNKLNEIFNEYNYIDTKIEKIKDKVQSLSIGSTIFINGIKKIYKGKIEKPIDKIKKMEQEYNEYCQQQISWAKEIIGDKYDDNEIIKLLDIYNKLIKNNNISNSEDSECELDIIVNKYKSVKIQEYEMLSEFGNSFITNNINDKSQIKNFIKNNKYIIYSYDSKDKINRFISTCKRIYRLSQIIEINNIAKSKCQTNIRDITNIEFENLLKLIDNNNKKDSFSNIEKNK